jgi:HSP20 family protein
MTITKWKKPSNGHETGTPVLYSSPFSNLMENFFNNNLFSGDFSVAVPPVNVSEDEEQYYVELSVPGLKKEDFKVEMDNKTLLISGAHQSEEEKQTRTYTRKEYNYGSFKRTFTLPETVNEEKIDAKYENGILRIILPKKEEAKAKPIKEIKIS